MCDRGVTDGCHEYRASSGATSIMHLASILRLSSIMHLSVTGRALHALAAGYPTTKWVKGSNLRRLPLVFLLVTRGVCVKRAGESVCEQCALSAWTKCLPPCI